MLTWILSTVVQCVHANHLCKNRQIQLGYVEIGRVDMLPMIKNRTTEVMFSIRLLRVSIHIDYKRLLRLSNEKRNKKR
jgi:hypothetical protein